MFTKCLNILLLFFAFFPAITLGQVCSTKGQTPSTAFPVCGVDTFKQVSVPACSTHPLAVPGCADADAAGGYTDKNPFWYQFTCYKSGTLGFLITPNNLGDDYDWQLYDITGHDPNDVFTDKSLVVSGNWSGSAGLTGAKAGGFDGIQCASFPAANAPRFSTMPNIVEGHTYLLLISHYTDSQSGYQLTFGGGTGSITDPTIPGLQSASILCDGETIMIKLSKKVKCSSLAHNGSDFTVSFPGSKVITASGGNCGTNFDMDSIILTLDSPLPPGNYTVTAKMGSDGNTLLDDCNNSLPVGSDISFAVAPQQPTPLDSISPVGCAPNQLQLIFSKPIKCNSIASDGSDFTITGPVPVTIQSANGVCNGNQSSVIFLNLNSPIVAGGAYHIKLKPGTDGNSIIDICNQETPAGSTIDFFANDTVSAAFSYQVMMGCVFDSIQYQYNGGPPGTQLQWTFDSSNNAAEDPLILYSVFGQKSVRLIATNGVCSDTAVATITLDNSLKADFTAPDNICPTDKMFIQNSSTGNNITSWNWDFGDGTSDSQKDPLPHSYPPSANEVKYSVQLVCGNSAGCFDTATVIVTKVRSCYITVPTAFTPNGDGVNDFLYPLNAWKAYNLEFKIFNRFGQLVFETKDWTKKWDGTLNGKPQDTGTYAWMLQYTDRDTGKRNFQKGTTVLIR